MKILVTAESLDVEGKVDPRFGRARQFALIDTESGEVVFIENSQNLNAPQGAGIQAAQTAARHGAQVVITGNVGPKAFTTLSAAGISVCTGATGTVREAVEQYQTGQLAEAGGANVEGHWT